jgi:hypothetical protein
MPLGFITPVVPAVSFVCAFAGPPPANINAGTPAASAMATRLQKRWVFMNVLISRNPNAPPF